MIKLTEDAAIQILAQINSSGSDDPLRIAVTKHAKTTGFQYLMGFDTQQDNDTLYDVRGVKLIVHNDLVNIINGMEIDFVKIESEVESEIKSKIDDETKQFIFKNPNDPSYKAPN
jgi:iron-sulfur cluster assembly protein